MTISSDIIDLINYRSFVLLICIRKLETREGNLLEMVEMRVKGNYNFYSHSLTQFLLAPFDAFMHGQFHLKDY